MTDRHGPEGARRGLEESRRFLSEGGAGMVGIHAAFTCDRETLEAAAALAQELGVGVHIHVAEGPEDEDAVRSLAGLTRDDSLLAHGVHLPDDHGLSGTILHQPHSNLNNSVGYANPARFDNPVALGTDGIGANMIDTFRLAYLMQRSVDVTASPETAWGWLENGWNLIPECRNDRVTWSYDPMDPWHIAFTPSIRPLEVEVEGEIVFKDGAPTRVDAAEIRAKARGTGGPIARPPMTAATHAPRSRTPGKPLVKPGSACRPHPPMPPRTRKSGRPVLRTGPSPTTTYPRDRTRPAKPLAGRPSGLMNPIRPEGRPVPTAGALAASNV